MKFIVQGCDSRNGRTWDASEPLDNKAEAEEIAGKKNNDAGRMTDGIVYTRYSVKEIDQ